jgi:hypothetical protein
MSARLPYRTRTRPVCSRVSFGERREGRHTGSTLRIGECSKSPENFCAVLKFTRGGGSKPEVGKAFSILRSCEAGVDVGYALLCGSTPLIAITLPKRHPIECGGTDASRKRCESCRVVTGIRSTRTVQSRGSAGR